VPVGGRLGMAVSLKEVRRSGEGVTGESDSVGGVRRLFFFFFGPVENMIDSKIRVYGRVFGFSYTLTKIVEEERLKTFESQEGNEMRRIDGVRCFPLFNDCVHCQCKIILHLHVMRDY